MADEAAAAAVGGAKPKTPADFLKSIKGKQVVVKLNSGVDYRGELRWPRLLRAAPAGAAGRSGCDAAAAIHCCCCRRRLPHAHRGDIAACLPATPPGVLACLDGYMNIAMEGTEEYVGGQLKAKYGDCFIRGNNGAPVACAL